MMFVVRSIKADLYRLFKSKGFYLTIILLVGFIFLNIQNEALGHIGVMENDGGNNLLEKIQWTADNALEMMLSQTFMLTYFCITGVVIILGQDFKNKTYKNIITTGITRVEYFIAKSVAIIVSSLILLIIFYCTTLLLAGFKNGFGEALTMNFHATQIKYILMKFFFICVNLMLGVAVLYSTRSNIAMVLTIVLAPIAIQIVSIILFPNVEILRYIDIQTALNMIGDLSNQEVMKYIIGALSMYGVCTAASMFVFERTEL